MRARPRFKELHFSCLVRMKEDDRACEVIVHKLQLEWHCKRILKYAAEMQKQSSVFSKLFNSGWCYIKPDVYFIYNSCRNRGNTTKNSIISARGATKTQRINKISMFTCLFLQKWKLDSAGLRNTALRLKNQDYYGRNDVYLMPQLFLQ